MKASEIIEFMEEWAPSSLAENWDNSGFQIGEDFVEVNKILLALDLDSDVLAYAKSNNCQMIISHHPFIFSGIKSITNKTYDGKLIIDMIKNDMVFYPTHTNMDQVEDGVSQELANKIKLRDKFVLDVTDEENNFGYGIVGKVNDIKAIDFITLVKNNLDVKNLTVFGDIEGRYIKNVAVMGGSGASYIESAKNSGADVLITGDVKYHDGQLANKLGLLVIDAGHYHTEKHILNKIGQKLKTFNKGLEVLIYENPSPLYKIY